MKRIQPLDLANVRTYSIQDRSSKVTPTTFAQPHTAGSSFLDFINHLPKQLKAGDLLSLADSIVAARRQEKPVIVLMGAHVIKVGLNPVLLDAVQNRIITGLALNGAGSIHDVELAYFGATSEDVAEGLQNGLFGMVRETGVIINETIHHGAASGKGYGQLLGERILADAPPHQAASLLAGAVDHRCPITVHVALGTDIVHQHPNADGAAIGLASYTDFKILAGQLCRLQPGAVVLLFGSAVILPEVFLKALTVARNLGHPAHGFTTASFDMISHYRPRVNVLQRPTASGGRYYELIGHHEILIPLLFAAVKEKLAGPR